MDIYKGRRTGCICTDESIDAAVRHALVAIFPEIRDRRMYSNHAVPSNHRAGAWTRPTTPGYRQSCSVCPRCMDDTVISAFRPPLRAPVLSKLIVRNVQTRRTDSPTLHRCYPLSLRLPERWPPVVQPRRCALQGWTPTAGRLSGCPTSGLPTSVSPPPLSLRRPPWSHRNGVPPRGCA